MTAMHGGGACDVPGCQSNEDDWYVWTPTGIRWCCEDCAGHYDDLADEARVDYRPDPDGTDQTELR